ncbi:espin-like protein isoform X2 [Mercenaria mercenaria]|uniref:espin-like protein isoform X2 n=1 Tax=Mercenaria mercenaria TaxID=6596 RepID=UPI00234F8B17|nr:espin-like protein isoform X2 [Mercenaria mercenaria]
MMLSYFDTEEQTADQARLYETCLKGSREEIRNYCRNGDIASLYIKDGMNPMHVVAIAGRKDAEVILDMMLQNGFHVNDQTMSGDDTVLHLIVEHIDVKAAFPLVLKILEYNPDLQIRNRKLRTPYDLALARGEFELAEVLDGHMTASEAREYYKNKIAAIYGAKLIDAVLRSNENDIQDFLKLGADPNYVNEHKNGAIHYAITHCTLPPQRTLQLLIDGKADVNLQDDEGDTALNLVIKMTKLKDTGEMYKCAELLVQNGALSTLKDLDGNDALSLAKKRQYDDIVKLLTDRRPQHIQLPPVDDSEADHPPPLPRGQEILPPLPESPNEEPEPATDSAEPRRQITQPTPPGQNMKPSPRPPLPPPPVREPAQLPPAPRLLPPPPDIDELSADEDESNHPPPMMPQDTLVRAIREGTLEEVNEALFGLRADPNIPGDDGLYPIHHVLIRGEMENEDERIDMLKSLIEAGADINQKTVNSESTALHVAATKNQYEEAQVLLDTHKCDYNLKNKHEKTAYDIAEEEECQEVMDVIENHRRRVRQRMQRAAKASTCIIL